MASNANDRQVAGDHYKSKIQHWDYVLANDIPYLEAQVIRYLTRWRKKGGADDVRKAHHFLQKLGESEGIDFNVQPAKAESTKASAGEQDGPSYETGQAEPVRRIEYSGIITVAKDDSPWPRSLRVTISDIGDKY